MPSLDAELDRARALDVGTLADAIETIGFECTRCGACCKAAETDDGVEEHTATVFPDEVRRLQRTGTPADAQDSDDPSAETDEADDATASGETAGGTAEASEVAYDWRDVARPMPYGIDAGTGETFEWALGTDDCGDCAFYEETDGTGACTVHPDRPLICRTYPFSVGSLPERDGAGDASGAAEEGQPPTGRTEPMGSVVDREGVVRAHECEGLGRDISRADAEELARALKERAVRELEEAIAVRDNYEPVDAEGVVVHDSEGGKRPDGTPLGDRTGAADTDR